MTNHAKWDWALNDIPSFLDSYSKYNIYLTENYD